MHNIEPTIRISIDQAKLTSYQQDTGKWLDYVRKYLLYGLEQKGLNCMMSEDMDFSSGLTNIVSVHLPILSSEIFSDAGYIDRIHKSIENAKEEPGKLVIGLIREGSILNQVASTFPELKVMKMYVVDTDTGLEIAGDKLWEGETLNFFLFKIYDLVNEIERSLKASKGQTLKKGKAVYLAEASPDLTPVKEEVRRELIRMGYDVYPDKAVPAKPREAEKQIMDYLSKCSLSIHLFGKLYLEAAPGEASLIELENRVAADYYSSKKDTRNFQFKRVMWMPDNLIVTNEKQIKFLEQIQRNKKLYAGADVVRSSVEELKDIIFEKLTDVPEGPKNGGSGTPNSGNENLLIDKKIVYIVNSEKNIEGAEAVKKMLEVFGCDVKLNDGMRNTFKDELRQCNSVLFYYRNEKPSWLRSKMCEVYKLKSWEYTSTFVKRGVLTFENQELPSDGLFKDVVRIPAGNNLEYNQLLPFFYQAK
ncbi:MAG TPA: hypothetical protein VIK89_14680 [Cytophagaceae bacterium]